MLVRIRGGDSGIKEYLENGKKAGRELGRDELDERVILSGDLDLTDSVINSMDKAGQKYLHVTLSFKEDEISNETLKAIAEEFREFAFSAYEEDEYNFYAEAHLPRVKSYTHKGTGEFIERKPHIHIVIPEQNLLTGQNLNPFGKVEQQTKFLEAYQEHINAKYGLASPKDNRRLEITGQSEMISRYKGDVFTGQGSQLKNDLLEAVIKNDVNTWSEFKELAAEYGAVKERRGGEYLNIKPDGAKRGVNLKGAMFEREFIELPTSEKLKKLGAAVSDEYSTPSAPKPTPKEISDRLKEWHDIRAKEVRYINSGNRKLYKEFREADTDRRREILAERERLFTAKWRKENDRQQHRNEVDRDITDNIRTADRYIKSVSGADERTTERARNVIDRRHSRAIRTAIKQLTGDERNPREARPERQLKREADNVTNQYRHDLEERQQQAKAAENEHMAAVKRELSAARLLAKVSHSHGVQPQRYEITKGRDGGDRIKCGTRNLNVSDFLTKELNLPWQEARQILNDTHREQVAQEPELQERRQPRAELWSEYREQWQPRYKKARAAAWEVQKKRDRQRRGELRQQWYNQKSRIEGNRALSYAEKRGALSVARMEKALADRELSEKIKAEREQLRNKYHKPLAEQYRTFLTEKAEQGNEAALYELRRQSDQRSKAEQGADTLQHSENKEPENAPILTRLNYKVDRKGDVHYSDTAGKRLFTDAGREVRTYDNKPHEIETALRLAMQKFGSNLSVNGTDEYKNAVLNVVVKSEIRVSFADPKMQQELEKRLEAQRSVKDFEQTKAAKEQAAKLEQKKQKDIERQKEREEQTKKQKQRKTRDTGHGL